MTRFPLAFRPTADLRAALERRAQAEGIATDDLGTYAGDLIAQALPEVVAELVNPAGRP